MTAVAVVTTARALVGEGPAWCVREQCLWWADVFAPAVHRLKDGVETIYPAPDLAGGCVVTPEHGLVVALGDALFAWRPDRGTPPVRLGSPPEPPVRLGSPPDLPAEHRLNDLAVDAAGRILVGTMRKSQCGPPDPAGILYVFSNGVWRALARGFRTINGLAVSPDGGRLYWSDSHPSVQRIWSADYAAAGTIGSPTLFADMTALRGRPDGAAMDAAGGYWIAAVDGGCVHRFAPDGRLDRTIDVPTLHPTKPAFGGARLSTLFLTSMSIRASTPDSSGHLLSIELDVPGIGR